MSMFTEVINPITGYSEWKDLCSNYDYHQDVSRSAFADMLHDTERNQKYFLALRKAIKNIHQKGFKAHVLDIGTGTGILAMMAVSSGADAVTACEAFCPMADCAEKIIGINGMSNKIKLIKKRSTELLVGDNGDLKNRANILVTEVFDTELIGEGAIEIFNHAHTFLLTEDPIVIPHSATVYVQLIESPLVSSWNKPKLLTNLDGDILLNTPPEINECCGESAVHDIQLSQINTNQFKSIVEPLTVFNFNWSVKENIDKIRNNKMKLISVSSGIVEAIFFWWDLKMDSDEEIILSCAPYWSHPDFNKLYENNVDKKKPIQNCIPWRDHWMQAVYYLPKPINLVKNQEFYFSANHDKFSFWFDACVKPIENAKTFNVVEKMKCTCSLHLAYSRNRIGQINNHLRNKKFLSVLENVIDKNSNVLCLSDGSLLGLSTAALGAKLVVCLESNTLSYRVMQSYIEYNKLDNAKLIRSLDEVSNFNEFTHVIGEPYFISSIFPWDNFYYGTLLNRVKNKLNENVYIMPFKAKIFALPVEFLDLYKIRSPLGACEGFNLTFLDEFLQKSIQLADENVETQPLWEYPCKALGEKQQILSVDFKKFEESLHEFGSINISTQGCCNGIALWIDWDLKGNDTEKYIVSTGPLKPIKLNEYITWDMYTRQGVHLFPTPKNVRNKSAIDWEAAFNPSKGHIDFKFKIV